VIDQTTQQAQHGDRTAQAKLLRLLQDPWYRLCLSLLRDPDRARDATQETALRFLKLLPRFEGNSTLSTWSMGIAINVVREMRRDAQKLDDADRVREVAATPRVAHSPEQDAVTGEHASLLRETLNELPERQREAVTLRFFENLSVEETAVAMQCAEGTVKATVHQALRALRSKLKQLS
jgi:RNA polymerase sigma-70 factor (ECF subfamily)